MGDKKKFCPDVAPGNGRAVACLEAARGSEGFSPTCRAELENLLAKRAADFRLDAPLAAACAADADALCGLELDDVAMRGAPADGDDAPVLSCLQDFKEEIVSDACKSRVRESIERASSDIRFDVPLATACAADRAKHCAAVAPGSAAVIRCLQDARPELTADCAAMLFDTEARKRVVGSGEGRRLAGPVRGLRSSCPSRHP